LQPALLPPMYEVSPFDMFTLWADPVSDFSPWFYFCILV
jgi:hypothetical protein